MVTEKTRAADGDCVMLLNAPEQVDLEFCQLIDIFIRHLFYHFRVYQEYFGFQVSI